MDRRKFGKYGITSFLAATPFISESVFDFNDTKELKNVVIHHVFFWLKNPENKEDLQLLLKGIKTLTKIKYLKNYHIGIPAPTAPRDVIDSSYSVSWMTLYNNVEDQDAYQLDPVHTDFVGKYKHLWAKAVVYDSKDAF